MTSALLVIAVVGAVVLSRQPRDDVTTDEIDEIDEIVDVEELGPQPDDGDSEGGEISAEKTESETEDAGDKERETAS